MDSARLRIVHVHPGFVDPREASGEHRLARGEGLRVGRSSNCDVVCAGAGAVLGGHVNAIFTLDADGALEVRDTGHANVVRNGFFGDGRGGSLRAGDVVDLLTGAYGIGAVGITFAVEDGPRAVRAEARPKRDLVTFSPAGQVRGDEVVVDRDGVTWLLDHRGVAHPDDAPVRLASVLDAGNVADLAAMLADLPGGAFHRAAREAIAVRIRRPHLDVLRFQPGGDASAAAARLVGALSAIHLKLARDTIHRA